MKQSFVLSIVLLLISLSHAEYVSPSQSPLLSPTNAPSKSDCSTVVYGMFDCLSFLSAGSTDLNPTKSCCVGVEGVLEYDPNCLCVALESSRSMGFDLIDSRALGLPSSCNIHITPHCDVASSPAPSAPASSSMASPPAAEPPKPSSSSPKPSLDLTPKPTGVVAPAPKTTHSSPAMYAPAPAPSKSGTGNLSLSKLFIFAVIVSSFAYVLA
ncbi:unnamed protein product [Microthlaspi erraticum]|uniref:Bifunctional inhibitor/plant lipid transfer protein/seed storage helical domain-containing protein n=1 Tax=Microthlaspi erraticum TaxID=1685480 RepID=A0A6D2I3T5_9BRAS|nr:unnamed protein product [Microthlaspi erraticum]